MGYRVKTVSALTGIPRGTLLAWERRYGILDPDRSVSGYREYTDADVALFKRLKALVDGGYSISEAVTLARRDAEEVSGASAADARAAQVAETPARVEVSDTVDRVLRALLAFDRTSADRLVPRLGQVSFTTAIDELYVPLLHHLGDLWERGQVTIAQEHFVSGFCREQLLAMFHGLGGGPESGVTVACATPPGERHELGLLVLAVKLALGGHRVIWLGADLPVPDLCAFLAQKQPRFACLSFTRPTSAHAVLEVARAVRAAAPPRTEILLGGHGLFGFEGTLPDGVFLVVSFAALEARLARAVEEPWRQGGSDRASG